MVEENPKPENPKAEGDTAPTVQVTSDAELMRKVEMLQSQLDTREKQLRQAIDVANRANDERKARDEAEKAKLVDSIVLDSHFSKDDLTKKTLGELQTMRLTLDKSIEKTFASVAAEIDEAKRVKQPYLTCGAFDSVTKKYVGGI